MKPPRVLALVMAGGEGGRMDVLTDTRAKPALPLAGCYRLIDVPLSNCVNSGIEDVWIVEQYQAHSLNEHLVNGRPWDLDRTTGGLRLLPPFTGDDDSGRHRGNADAIYRNRRLITSFDPDLVLVLSADHVYRLDYRDVIAAHNKREAEVTLVTTEVPKRLAGRFGTVETTRSGRVASFEYKPDAPSSGIVTTEVFVYSAGTLLQTLEELADGGDELEDFGNQLLPRMVQRGKAWAYPLDGYWRDVGTIASYWRTHQDLLRSEPPIRLDDPNWALRTHSAQRLPARIDGGAVVENSLIAPGCRIAGTVRNCVLGPGVEIEAGALVDGSVVFEDVLVARGARVAGAIVDSCARIGAEATVGGDARPEGDDDRLNELLAVVGMGARIASGRVVEPGARLKPAVD